MFVGGLTGSLGLLAPGLPPALQAQSASSGAAKAAAGSQSQATDTTAATQATGSAATNGSGKAQATAGGAAQAANGAAAASTAAAKVGGGGCTAVGLALQQSLRCLGAEVLILLPPSLWPAPPLQAESTDGAACDDIQPPGSIFSCDVQKSFGKVRRACGGWLVGRVGG